METKNNRVIPFKAIHPGEILNEELKERGLSQKEFSKIIDVRPSHLNELIKGKRNLNSEMAHKLEAGLNIPYKIWMDLQTGYLEDKKGIEEKNNKVPKNSYALALGQEMASARKKEKLSQAQLGEMVGYSASFISKIEKGQIETRISVFCQIANALGLNVSLSK